MSFLRSIYASGTLRLLPLLGMLFAGLVVSAREAGGRGGGGILLVTSSQRQEYSAACEGFAAVIENESPGTMLTEAEFPGPGQGEEAFWLRAAVSRPSVIVTIGSAATRSALRIVDDAPVISTMVLEDFGGLAPGEFAGNVYQPWCVNLTVPLGRVLSSIRRAVPTARRVGILLNRAGEYGQALPPGEMHGLRLSVKTVSGRKEIPAAIRALMEEIDLLWVPPDREIYRKEVLEFILRECFRGRLPVVAYSPGLAVAGAPLAVSVDYEDIGRQTAELALERLATVDRERRIVHQPRSLLLYVNERVSSSLRLHIPRNVIENAIIVGEGKQPDEPGH